MKAKPELHFVTGNAAKAKYLGDYFHMPVLRVTRDIPEIQSLNPRLIVEEKVKRAYEIVQKPVLVEDASLVFLALGKLPGPLIKWFFETLGNKGLCRLLDAYPTRRAVAEVWFGFCDERGVKFFSAKKEGSIAREPAGTSGFAWDPIFIPRGHAKIWAEMTDREKHKTSMRRVALEKLKRHLNAERFL